MLRDDELQQARTGAGGADLLRPYPEDRVAQLAEGAVALSIGGFVARPVVPVLAVNLNHQVVRWDEEVNTVAPDGILEAKVNAEDREQRGHLKFGFGGARQAGFARAVGIGFWGSVRPPLSKACGRCRAKFSSTFRAAGGPHALEAFAAILPVCFDLFRRKVRVPTLDMFAYIRACLRGREKRALRFAVLSYPLLARGRVFLVFLPTCLLESFDKGLAFILGQAGIPLFQGAPGSCSGRHASHATNYNGFLIAEGC